MTAAQIHPDKCIKVAITTDGKLENSPAVMLLTAMLLISAACIVVVEIYRRKKQVE